MEKEEHKIAQYQISVLGLDDNVIDKYERIKTMCPGGNCVNFTVYVQMLEAERSIYMGYFGNGTEMEYTIHTLEEIGIETVKCKQLEGGNDCVRVTPVDGDRVFLGFDEGGVRGETPLVLDHFDIEYIRQFDFVHSGNYCSTGAELPKTKAADAPVSSSFSDDSTEEYYQEMAPNMDYTSYPFDGTDGEAREHLEQVVSYKPKLAVTSRGADSYILYDGKDFCVQKAAPIKNVIDTIGTDDFLVTSLMVGYVDRLKKGVTGAMAIRESLEETVKFAAKIYGISGTFGYGKVYE